MKPGNAIEVKDLKITYKCVKALSLKKFFSCKEK